MIAVALVGACTATAQSEPRRPAAEPRIIEGTVRDAVTKQPIDRASVDVTRAGAAGEARVGTGSDGRYRTGEIPRGPFDLRVRREGYLSFHRAGTMEDGIAQFDVELVPSRR
ncbi:MAG TPA: carboxypeptidase-like regulatory domain-containing protein [Kofleriaceae bacterium]|nr:carboxypeptidase-like regulatory domain-containing protein [Kofleriaceae bacterium]